MCREIDVGERFGRLVVIYRVPGSNPIKYHCKCDCGKEVDIVKYGLLKGDTRSCGCLKSELLRKRASKDLVGKRFGRLTVLSKAGMYNGQQKWLCKCDCGNTTEVITSYLTTGDTKSCGCYKIDKVTKHGYSKTKLYRVYQSMLQRCQNPKAQEYERYGGRGISVCKEWKENFVSFCEWANANEYKEGMTLDRVNNDGNYEPSNCRWATRKEQAVNRSTNRYLSNGKEIHTVSQWADILKIPYTSVYGRVRKGELCEV
jgi:hypothetical protein